MAIPEGKCVIHKLTIGFLDDSLSGHDHLICAEGLMHKNNSVEKFEYHSTESTIDQFLAEYPGLSFYTYGTVHILDEPRFLDLSIATIAFDEIKGLFPELRTVILNLESYLSTEYDAMKAAAAFHHEWTPRMN